MFDFSKYLEEDEKILYEGRPVPGKGDKSIGGCIFIIVFVAIIQALLIWSLVYKVGDGAEGITLSYIIIFAVTLLFDALAVYNIAYLKFFKKRAVKDDYFCITNKRALKYESKKNMLVYGYLVNYVHITCENEKDGYGDLCMHIDIGESGDAAEDLAYVKDIMTNPNPENMPTMIFECIEKPRNVRKIVVEARDKILESNNK